MTDASGFFRYPTEPPPPVDAGFLGDRTAAEWATFLRSTQTRRFRAGETVLRSGEPDRALYVLIDGRLQGAGGVVEAPSTVGEGGFLDGAPRAVTMSAVTDGELLRLSWDAFEALAAREPLLARAVLVDLGRILAARLRGADPGATGWTG